MSAEAEGGVPGPRRAAAAHELQVRALAPGDSPALMTLRREALESAPLAFGASPEDDRALSPVLLGERLSAPESSAVFGAFPGGTLSGMAGIVRQEKLKARHLAVIWGVYVTPAARGLGLGRALLDAAVERARGWPGVVQVHLSVSDAAPEASRLYLRCGFREWGVEPRALHWQGRFVAEHHMVLDLGR